MCSSLHCDSSSFCRPLHQCWCRLRRAWLFPCYKALDKCLVRHSWKCLPCVVRHSWKCLPTCYVSGAQPRISQGPGLHCFDLCICMAASRICLMNWFDSYYVMSLDSIAVEATCMCSRAHSRRRRAAYLPRSPNLTRSCQVPLGNLGHMQLDRATVQQSLGAQMQKACRWEILHTAHA